VQHRHRGVEAQRLLQDQPDQRHLLRQLRVGHAGGASRTQLLSQDPVHVRVPGQQRQGHRGQQRRRVVAGDDERHGLVPDPRAVEGVVLLPSGGHQQAQDVVPGRGCVPACVDQVAQVCVEQGDVASSRCCTASSERPALARQRCQHAL
jgi:hypothetical protein